MRQLRKCSHVVIAAFRDYEKIQKTDLKHFFRCTKILGDAGKQEILQQMFRKF